MILGFAHITKNRIGVAQSPRLFIPSAPEKWPLMARRASAHRIIFQPSWSDVPEETIEYDTGIVTEKGRLGVGLDRILCLARDANAEALFFRDALGFLVDDFGKLTLGSMVRSWRIRLAIAVDEDAPLHPPLDIAGYAALAFYSSDVEADRDHLLKHGGRTPTEPFTVEIDRKMKIVMLRSPEGTIIELIQVLK
jgi:hypothetical protein